MERSALMMAACELLGIEDPDAAWARHGEVTDPVENRLWQRAFNELSNLESAERELRRELSAVTAGVERGVTDLLAGMHVQPGVGWVEYHARKADVAAGQIRAVFDRLREITWVLHGNLR